MPKTTISYLDESVEIGRVSFYTPQLDGTNADSFTDDTGAGALNSLVQAVDALSLGTNIQRSVIAAQFNDTKTPPVDDNAQRERKAQFTYQDDVTLKLYRFEIPCYNLVGKQANSDNIDLANATVVNLVTAVESNYVSDIGNPITIVSGKHVGRSS